MKTPYNAVTFDSWKPSRNFHPLLQLHCVFLCNTYLIFLTWITILKGFLNVAKIWKCLFNCFFKGFNANFWFKLWTKLTPNENQPCFLRQIFSNAAKNTSKTKFQEFEYVKFYSDSLSLKQIAAVVIFSGMGSMFWSDGC